MYRQPMMDLMHKPYMMWCVVDSLKALFFMSVLLALFMFFVNRFRD